MANKRKRARLRKAAARKEREEQKVVNDGAPKPGARWCTQSAQWINPDEDGDDLYDVACQLGEGKPIYTGMYRAEDDTALLDLVCKMMGVSKESEFTHLTVFKTIPDGGGVIIVREVGDWPHGVPIIRTKGVTAGGRGTVNTPRIVTPLHSYSTRPREEPTKTEVKSVEVPKTTAATVAAVMEKSIPRVPYTLKQAV